MRKCRPILVFTVFNNSYPRPKDSLSIISKLVIEFGPINSKIVDLGCGLGDEIAEILKLKPNVNVPMLDLSDEMIR